ncbi:hypothetical protein FisN_12Lh122 [Fistulifera solaris]|uniref:Uncharacterized protein n=1 Tax=Fistulifera solaris TaxID=1519565 RepID=A0A1Z5JME6_FISSO|nr:hypothetical protein FisN_12Lh122 [Fistulifera solaris]|eukprot:GAX15175.1 hypothetical protein FisN_12Lh122 [Fistulifera solaris]
MDMMVSFKRAPVCFYYWFLITSAIVAISVHASSGSVPFFRQRPSTVGSHSHRSISSLSPRSQRYIHEYNSRRNNQNYPAKASLPPRGGQGINQVVRVVSAITQILIECGNLVLPPAVAIARLIVRIYRALPKDAIVAQVGLVYCFAGGYYPTLFSSLQAAQQYGWNVMVHAIQDLADEALAVIQVLEDTSQFSDDNDDESPLSFRQTTGIVFATVDPRKINQASAALYTTWMGVSSVLQREYARVITLSLTMADYIERVAVFLLAPPAYLCVPDEYHRWVPVVIGWGCKALSINIAWRLQRVMTAATSAITGGLLFARAISRMIWRRKSSHEGSSHASTVFDEIIGFIVAGLGFYTQFESQWRSGFSFRVPFPISLVTWPFDLAENWIQWQITKQ